MAELQKWVNMVNAVIRDAAQSSLGGERKEDGSGVRELTGYLMKSDPQGRNWKKRYGIPDSCILLFVFVNPLDSFVSVVSLLPRCPPCTCSWFKLDPQSCILSYKPSPDSMEVKGFIPLVDTK